MLDIFEKYAVNLEAEVNGVWKEVGPAKFLIARADNEEFNKAVVETYEKHREELSEKGEASNELARKLMAGVMADTLVLDWEGVGYKGEELEYSRENVIMLFSQPELRDFQTLLLNMAADAENFRLKAEEAQKKN